MKLPWVSRDRLEELQERLRASEDERRVLLDRLAMLRGEPPIFAKVEPAPAVVLPTPVDPLPMHVVPKQEQPAPPKHVMAGSVTADHILAAAAQAVKEGKMGRPVRVN